ncbi:MAG: hypothetical protein AAGF95_04860 [Chloroflexota bacterium]
MSHKQKWLLFSPIGLLLLGCGISFLGDATIRKNNGEQWFMQGTIGLTLLNVGMSIFGDAVKERGLHELEISNHIDKTV